MNVAYDIQAVSFAYGEQPVLQNVSLSLVPGRFYGIVGPNGCGKTTLLDLLTRHQRPGAGVVRYRGKNLVRYSKKALAREVALVPQNYYINFPFTAGEVVMMGRYPHIPRFSGPSAEDVRMVHEIMARTDTEAFAGRFVTELSGGERQRVIFARALAQDTPVLILDEATSNLDIRHALSLLGLTAGRVADEGRTVIAVFQDINLAAAYCGEIVFMRDGRIAAQGPTDEVLRPETIRAVFGVEAKIYYEPYAGCRQVVFKR
jgi:ABC-type cobalamin/Fe3+-siderophores transport system ATPase subunit